MVYIEPTPSDLKARCPAFAGVDDATIAYWLTDAHRFVDQSWMEQDYGPALIARAAHDMVEAKVAGIAQDEVEELAGSGLTQFKSGSFSASFSEAAAAQAAEGGLGSTKYGREYLELLRRNKGGLGVTGPGCVPAPCGFNGYAGPLPPYCQ
jgi:hypothetical protein